MSAQLALASLCNYSSESDICSEPEEIATDFHEKLSDFLRLDVLLSIADEAVRRVEAGKQAKYRIQKASEGPSSCDSSSSSSSTSSVEESDCTSGDDSDDSDAFVLATNNQRPGKRQGNNKNVPKVKGELSTSDLPAIEDLQISVADYECVEIGSILSIVDDLVVVKALPNTAALDLETVLFLEKGSRPLGRVFDVMGPVVQPFYCVRFNSNEHIKDKNVTIGLPVYYAPRTEHTSFVFLAELMKLKGSDASWEHDKEPPPNHIEYSDDDEERNAKKKKSGKNPPVAGQSPRPAPQPAYRPPGNEARTNNVFYRRQRRYNPRESGPIRWNSMHTQHLPPGRPGPFFGQYRFPPPGFPPNPFSVPPPPMPPRFNFGPNGPR